MKLTSQIFVLTLMASAALAQTGIGPIDAAHRAAKASNAKTEQTNKVLNGNPQNSVPASASPARSAPFAPKMAAKPASSLSNKAIAAPRPQAKPASEEKAKAAPEMKKMRSDARDPFVSIIRNADKSGGVPCVSGKKCLVIGEIVLRGVVRSPNAIIAVVENPQKKTYFLHENDPVFNGNVVEITGDSVVFREQVIDRVGRKSTRDVTKHINPRPIA